MAKFTCLVISCSVFLILFLTTNLVSLAAQDDHSFTPTWAYKCDSNRCVKVEANKQDIENNLSLSVCRLFCGSEVGTLWPYPTGTVKVGNTVVRFDPQKISFDTSTLNSTHQFAGEYKNLMELVESKKRVSRWSVSLQQKKPDSSGSSVVVAFDVANLNTPFDFDLDQSYKLKITKASGKDVVNVQITAQNSFGARYALTTLSQLIVFDDFRREMLITGDVLIIDEPAFKHRGILLDTSRNYYSVQSIKRTIHAMSMSKLNVFHWHITDSQSFPLVVKSQPDLYRYGAYEPDKIYSPEDIREIVEFGRIRGVAVVPEFDAPAHVGEGWQKTDLTACFNAQPWARYCVEPPCGQLDPTEDRLYDVLEDIYRTMWEEFQHPHLFHMGGDEVSVSCWNSSERIQKWMLNKGWKLQEKDFIRLWGHFQENAKQRLDKVRQAGGGGDHKPIVLWTSRLTEVPYVNEFVDKHKTIIQIWTMGHDPKVMDILKLGFRVIVSNYDALYLDCGFAGWVTNGNNWCSPFIGWQKIYDNRMEDVSGKYVEQVLGAEAALWSEQADELTMDSRLWPRGSALAERLWTNPSTDWKSAQTRILTHREELVRNGVGAETLQPEWCVSNEGNCHD